MVYWSTGEGEKGVTYMVRLDMLLFAAVYSSPLSSAATKNVCRPDWTGVKYAMCLSL